MALNEGGKIRILTLAFLHNIVFLAIIALKNSNFVMFMLKDTISVYKILY